MKQLYSTLLLALPALALQAQTTNDFRTVSSGVWTTIAIWERYDGSAWVPAAAAPTSGTANEITIRAPHVVDINAALSIDQTTIAPGATLSWNAGVLTIANGVGTDFIVNGTFIDNSVSAAAFGGAPTGAKWQLGANGTYIKQRNNSAAVWRDNYEGTMSTIPATSNWIVRKMSTTNPAIVSVNGTGGQPTMYGNLIFENTHTAHWTTTTGSILTGSTGGFPTVKGNLDIGGSGTNTVDVLYDNFNASAMPVGGNFIIRTGNTFRNFGTGIDLQGNLTVNGTLNYGTANGRRITFTGGNLQTVSGSGTLNMLNMTVAKPINDVQLLRPLTVDGNLTLTSGVVFTTAANLLTLAGNATLTVSAPTTNNSYVSGPIRKINTAAGFTFPVGKSGNYQPLSISPSSFAGGTFWTEDFGTGTCANRLQLVSSYAGANGAWALNVINNGSNTFYVSSTEAGMGEGNCGNGCISNPALTNQTLHVGNKPGSNCGCLWCAAGDCGAAYDACGTNFCGGGMGAAITNVRAESPVINCSGRSNIEVSFLYMEVGSGTNDNAELWYFDGAAWSMISDMPKTTNCSGSQGRWTAGSAMLPASANNNPNVRIGFRWINNADDSGSDPSFAVDDVRLSEIPPLEVFTCEYFLGNPVSDFGSAKEASVGDIVSNEYWILDRNVGTASKHVTMNWDASSQVADMAGSKIVRWDGAMWRDHGNGGTTGFPVGDPGCTSQAACGNMSTGLIVSSFSPFSFSIPPIPTPLQLLQFQARLDGKRAHLYWRTSQETNTQRFDIEKSRDAVHFDKIGQVQAAGNSATELYYEHYDPALWTGVQYYRLRMVDADGSFAYSPVASVEYKPLGAYSVYPNPTRDRLFVHLPGIGEATVHLQLFDLVGRTVERLASASTAELFEMDLSDLPAGNYVLRITAGEAVVVEKVVKQ